MTSRMTATDELRRLLDGRGKEHRVWPSGLVIWHDEGSWVYEYSPPKGDDDYWGGILHATLRHCTPDQAIEATLGRGECELPTTYLDHGHIEYNGVTEWRKCSGCGREILAYPANYCPNCGRKVVDA